MAEIQPKITKNYLKSKLKASIMVIWLFFGFLSGAALGKFIFVEGSGDIIQLTFVYSSEKATWIGETQTEFEAYWEDLRVEDPSLKPISLDFQPYGSGSSLIALLNGEIKPIIWSPASNIWVPILNTKWQDITDSDQILIHNYTRSIYSPVVIATWENFNNTHNIAGINALHDYIVDHPNEIKMGHTDPRSSNSGFMATIMMVSSVLNMNPELITLDNISQSQVINFMQEIESTAVQYGESTGFLGRYMRDNGPDALTISFLYENLIQDFSLDAEANFGQKLIAIYPEEGSLYSDHPFCILDADWVSEDQEYVAKEYLSFISQKDMIKKAIATGFRPINTSLLLDADVQAIYNTAFNENLGVTSDPSVIHELISPSSGEVLSRIPDLWLMTRATAN